MKNFRPDSWFWVRLGAWGHPWMFVDVRGRTQSTLNAPGSLIPEPSMQKAVFLSKSVSEGALAPREKFTDSKRFLHNQSHLYDSFEHLGWLGLQNNIDCNCVRAYTQPEPTNKNFRWNRPEHHFDRNLHLGTSTIDHERPQPSRMILNHHKPPQDALWALWMFVDVAIVDGSCVEEMT